MSVVWPPGLPDLQPEGLSVERQNTTLRTQMDAGPEKVRRRFSAAAKTLRIPMMLSGAQLAIFRTFYETTLSEGVTQFQWENPETDATVSFRFLREPVWSLETGSASTSTRRWVGSLDLEIIP